MTPMDVVQEICSQSILGIYPQFSMTVDEAGVVAMLSWPGVSICSKGPVKDEVLESILLAFYSELSMVLAAMKGEL